MPLEHTGETRPSDVLQQLVGVFAHKGWLNETVRIKHRDRRYRISCTEKAFIAYRANDNWGIPPGVPGWPVCIVDNERIIEDSGMSPFASDEPSAHDWLRCIAGGDFEAI